MNRTPALIDLQWFAEDNPGDGKGAAAGSNPGKGSVASDWISDLPDDLKSLPTIAKFSGPQGPSTLAKSYVELEKKLGQVIVLPKGDAKPEEWEKFYSQVGRPESPDNYQFDPVVGFDTDKAVEASIKKMAHAAGLSQAQAAKLYAFYGKQALESAKATRSAAEAEKAKTMGQLKEAWGQNYEHNLELADRFLDKVGGDGTAQYLKDKGYANDPVLLTIFAHAGELTGAHKFVVGSRGSTKAPANPYAYMDQTR